MKTINSKSTALLCRLLDNMMGEDCLIIENEPYTTLTLEKIKPEVNLSVAPCPRSAPVYSLMQSYTDLNGTLMVEPEMQFVVFGYLPNEPQHNKGVLAVPFVHHSTREGIYEKSMLFHEKRMPTYHSRKQAAHTAIADKWFENIEQQGYLDACLYF